MTRSLANGDYSLVMAIESASRPDSWYRVLADRQTGALSCDCPPWTFKQGQDAGASTERSCPHTRFAGQLALRTPLPGVQARRSGEALSGVVPSDLLAATQQQWPGLRGHWSIDGRVAEVNEKPYQLILLGLEMGNGGSATGVAAFAERHHPTLPRLQAGVAGWCGYAIAAEVARRGGFPLAGQPPEHFRVTASRGRATGRSPQEPRPREGRPSGAPVVPRLGLRDILRIGDQVNLGDGLVPIQRAENTLRLFLGEGLYGQLEVQRFLDVSSVRYADRRRVYRLRRDPAKCSDRRVRVFEQGRYINDFCIVRAQDVPEADHYLTVFLTLLSDEESVLAVVQHYNIFEPYSEFQYGRGLPPDERETAPAVWRPRVA